MSSSTSPKSRAWTVVVAATAVTAIGGATAAAAWGSNAQVPQSETVNVALSEQRPIAAESKPAGSAQWTALAAKVGDWQAESVPSADSPFSKAGGATAAQDVQSASVQSVQSADSAVSAQSAQSPASASVDSPASVQSPASVDSPNSPDSPQTPDSPESVSADSPDSYGA
ncbi:hypothetical protein MWU75_07635 [Ornithinimicrobium sp. F0845]|uniref:hypothetical protein n=1 Tax=Ornithinimicrobium sp. F0845 TaxID=2926412 RepID=UPI001FF2F1F0|nr:hypothetical protein [Ornithinimicrobium sp. F0845]MCK0112004.1 hypothetical protein [Ornithinimicrobium sp. F0845]